MKPFIIEEISTKKTFTVYNIIEARTMQNESTILYQMFNLESKSLVAVSFAEITVNYRFVRFVGQEEMTSG